MQPKPQQNDRKNNCWKEKKNLEKEVGWALEECFYNVKHKKKNVGALEEKGQQVRMKNKTSGTRAWSTNKNTWMGKNDRRG